MDRDKAVEYFKKLGFPGLPSKFSSGGRYLSSGEIAIEGDALGGGDVVKKNAPVEFQHHNLRITNVQFEAKTPQPVISWTACYCVSRSNRPDSAACHGNDSRPSSSFVDSYRHLKTKRDGCDNSDDDDDRLSLDKLLEMLDRLTYSHPARCNKAGPSLKRLASCFSLPGSVVTDLQAAKLLRFLDHGSSPTFREVSLTVVDTLLTQGGGFVPTSHPHIVDRIIMFVGLSSEPTTQILALNIVEKLLSLPELPLGVRRDLEKEVYPDMMKILHSSSALNVKYSACCVLRAMAKDFSIAVRVKKESVFFLQQLRESSAKLKEVYVGVLLTLLSHPGLLDDTSMDTSILPVVKGLLRDGPCETQRAALELVVGMLGDDGSVMALLNDQRIVAYVLGCLLTSMCRKVRSQASHVVSMLMCTHKTIQARLFLECVSYYLQPIKGFEAGVAGGDKARVTYPNKTSNQSIVCLWHDMDCFLDALAGLVSSEGLLEMESDHLVCELSVKGQLCDVQLTALANLLQAVTNICCWPLFRRWTALCSRQDLVHLTEDISIRDKFSTVNHRLAVQQWKRFGSRIMAIFKWLLKRIDLQQFQSTVPTKPPLHSSRSAAAKPPTGRRGSLELQHPSESANTNTNANTNPSKSDTPRERRKSSSDAKQSSDAYQMANQSKSDSPRKEKRKSSSDAKQSSDALQTASQSKSDTLRKENRKSGSDAHKSSDALQTANRSKSKSDTPRKERRKSSSDAPQKSVADQTANRSKSDSTSVTKSDTPRKERRKSSSDAQQKSVADQTANRSKSDSTSVTKSDTPRKERRKSSSDAHQTANRSKLDDTSVTKSDTPRKEKRKSSSDSHQTANQTKSDGPSKSDTPRKEKKKSSSDAHQTTNQSKSDAPSLSKSDSPWKEKSSTDAQESSDAQQTTSTVVSKSETERRKSSSDAQQNSDAQTTSTVVSKSERERTKSSSDTQQNSDAQTTNTVVSKPPVIPMKFDLSLTRSKSEIERSSSATPPSTITRPNSAKLFLKRCNSTMTVVRPPAVRLKEQIGEGEWVLLHSILNFLLCAALVTCKNIPDPLAEEEGSATTQAKTANPPLSRRRPMSASAASSPVVKGPNSQDKAEDSIPQKELASDRRVLRREMFNEGLFKQMGKLLSFTDPELKMICSLIVRLSTQPVEEKKMKSKDPYLSYGPTSRPPSAKTLRPKKSQKAINVALHKMRPSSASLIKEALNDEQPQRPASSASLHPTTSPAPPETSTIKASVVKISSSKDISFFRLMDSNQEDDDMESAKSTRSQTDNEVIAIAPHTPSISSQRFTPPAPPCTPFNQPVAAKEKKFLPIIPGDLVNLRCLQEAVLECAEHALRDLFFQSHKVRHHSLLFLHDLVKRSDCDLHMELSKLGIIPKLLDFIRINEDKEQLEITGLRVLKMLVLSEVRLRQLFAHHRGHTVLVVLTRCRVPAVQLEARTTLTAINKADRGELAEQSQVKRKPRPASAPVSRAKSEQAVTDTSSQPKDIWDQIMHRWQEEDKVVAVLKQFTQH